MRKPLLWITISSCVAVAALLAFAQSTRQPGLWETTSTMTWQQSPLPPNIQMPSGSPFGGGAHTTQVCVTQAMIDKYGAPVPESRGECQIANVNKTPTSMSADWVCTGKMAGKGTLESHWSADGHATGKVHFTGNMQMGPNARPVEWTIDSSSIYKGADCGNVKPIEMPAGK